jgi:hypothetical protein
VRQEPFVELNDWLEPSREMWLTHLDRLEAHLESRRTT